MDYKHMIRAAVGTAAAVMVFGATAQTQGSRSNPPTPSPPHAQVPEKDSVNVPNQTDSQSATPGALSPTTNTGNSGTDPAMQPGAAVPPNATPGATPGTAGTESGSTDLTPTEPGSSSDTTTRTN